MDDPISSGMIGYAIKLLGDQILRHIHVAIRWKKELDELKLLLLKIKTMNVELQEYGKAFSTSPHHPLPSTVKSWLNELNALLEEASDLAHHCTVPQHFHLLSRYRMSRKIRQLTANVDKHLASTPLVIGDAMAGVTQSNEWEFALQRLQNDISGTLLSRLRLSYDALAKVAGYGISLQLCFLCVASFSEDRVIDTGLMEKYWIGEGLLAGQDPSKIGEIYVNLLADRCLIEPVQKDCDGNVIYFRVHDVLHDLAQQIVEKEEKFFFQSGRGLSEFPADQCSGHVRISLMDNNLTSIPKAFRAPYIRSLLLAWNRSLTEIPKEVIGSMTALRVLDLSYTAI
ncbi:hypothetical protein SUGI_0518080 [Cryptomeria japonica]|nr:hypothetical protein SUGI_0518080 [Cryptomeria japonica]